ncbi:hypothetical protein [Flavobacterium sp. F52]|uniref:hypothetical protein n=2 Tax=Flavobacterium sp. F52 TaxID=1202532 RepID=UPI0002E45184|nr:hypothetical protein [Flavobacterium sp. F52]
MKKLRKSIMFFLLFGTIIITASCSNEEIDTGQLTSQDTKIGKAKDWFDSYKSNSTTNKSEEGEINKAFRNLDYYWENAKVIKLDNNATGISVPVKDNPENPEYKGQKMLYLYESDSKYQALLQEIFPESKDKIDDDQKKLGFGDLTLFSGYILNWDLKKGFLKGAKLKDGLVIGDVRNIITLYDQDVKSDMTSKMIEMFDESANYGGERDDTLQKGGTAAIPLNNVIVVQKSPAPAPRDFSIAGAFSDGGSGGNSGTPTGGGSGSVNGLSMPPPPKLPISDIKKFLSCLNTAASANLTVYAEKSKLSNLNVGHAFISISQGNNVMTYGFYPENGYDKSFSGPGIMGENGGHIYDVSANIGQISPQQLQQIISLSVKYQNSWYDIDANNCSDFAADVLNIVGVASNNSFETPTKVANTLQKVPNHTSNPNYAPKTKRTCT